MLICNKAVGDALSTTLVEGTPIRDDGRYIVGGTPAPTVFSLFQSMMFSIPTFPKVKD